MPLTEDPTDFLDVEEHATAGVLDGVDVVGILDRESADIEGLLARRTTYYMSEAAMTAIGAGKDSTLAIPSGPNAGTYRVRTPEPDGTGFVLLPLEKQ